MTFLDIQRVSTRPGKAFRKSRLTEVGVWKGERISELYYLTLWKQIELSYCHFTSETYVWLSNLVLGLTRWFSELTLDFVFKDHSWHCSGDHMWYWGLLVGGQVTTSKASALPAALSHCPPYFVGLFKKVWGECRCSHYIYLINMSLKVYPSVHEYWGNVLKLQVYQWKFSITGT